VTPSVAPDDLVVKIYLERDLLLSPQEAVVFDVLDRERAATTRRLIKAVWPAGPPRAAGSRVRKIVEALRRKVAPREIYTLSGVGFRMSPREASA